MAELIQRLQLIMAFPQTFRFAAFLEFPAATYLLAEPADIFSYLVVLIKQVA